MPRRPQFTKKEHDEIVKLIRDELHDDLVDHQTWVDKRAQALEDMIHANRGIKDYPWEGASNITPPLVAKLVRAVWPRITNAILGMSPLVQAVAVNPADQEDAEARAAWHNHRIVNMISRFKRKISTWIIDFVHGGDAVLKVTSDLERDYEPEWRVLDNFVPITNEMGEIVDALPKTDEAVLDEVFENGVSYTKKGGGEYKVTYLDEGREYTAFVMIDRDDPAVREDELSVTIEGEKVDRNLNLRVVTTGSLIPTAGATGLQYPHSHHLSELHWFTVEEIKMNPSFFNLSKKDLKDLEKMSKGELLPVNPELVEEVEDDVTGVPYVWGLSGVKQKKIRVIEHYRPYTTRGRQKQMIFWVIPALDKLARWDYVKTIFGHGQRPYVDAQFLPLPNNPRGLGLWHLVHPYQDEASTIFNQMNDRENLRNNPQLLVAKTAGISAGDMEGKPPGTVHMVRDPSLVVPLQWPLEDHMGMSILQNIFAYAEQIAGIGDIQAGIQPNRPNAPRTARGTLALISEGNIIIDTHIALVQEAFAELIMMIDALDEQYMPPEIRFMTTGKQERVITRQQFRKKVRFFLSGNTTNTNQQVQQAVSELLYTSLRENPFFTGAYLQLDPLAIVGHHKITMELVQKHAPHQDASSFLQPVERYIQEAQQFQQAQAQAQEEKNRFERQMALRKAEREDLDTQIDAFEATGKVQSDRKKNETGQLQAVGSLLKGNVQER